MSRGGASADVKPFDGAGGAALPFLWDRDSAAGLSAGAWGYFLFILVNATLFVRPAEIVPALLDWPIYAVVATVAVAVAARGVMAQLTFASLVERPITV